MVKKEKSTSSAKNQDEQIIFCNRPLDKAGIDARKEERKRRENELQSTIEKFSSDPIVLADKMISYLRCYGKDRYYLNKIIDAYFTAINPIFKKAKEKGDGPLRKRVGELKKDINIWMWSVINDKRYYDDYNGLTEELENFKMEWKEILEDVAMLRVEPSEAGQEHRKPKPKKRGRKKDPKVKSRNKEIAKYKDQNPKLCWKEIGQKFNVSDDIARKACNDPDN
ncbi:MAG: hypothetical protein KAJ18_11115 [Candidatus Omnitrophica bacterium]|nr:hypothetical protein [Candidatus Omnitrophota bacterium]